MQSPPDAPAAKEFLVRCIVDEAQREGTPLTDTERDMLYFSETYWTLPNIFEINEAFERDYDQGEYETKISALIRNFKTRAAKEDSAALEAWNDSVRILEAEDHYILVMIRIADGHLKPGPTKATGPTRMLRLLTIGTVAGIGAVLLTFVILFIARK
jgi:hypothetical protein